VSTNICSRVREQECQRYSGIQRVGTAEARLGVSAVDCECLGNCPFFHDRMKNMPTASELLKQQYCHGDWASCARCMIFQDLGREAVPFDLFPDETDRAIEILEASRG
jgi:hypothetical protein